jgi:hypothetical protein
MTCSSVILPFVISGLLSGLYPKPHDLTGASHGSCRLAPAAKKSRASNPNRSALERRVHADPNLSERHAVLIGAHKEMPGVPLGGQVSDVTKHLKSRNRVTDLYVYCNQSGIYSYTIRSAGVQPAFGGSIPGWHKSRAQATK